MSGVLRSLFLGLLAFQAAGFGQAGVRRSLLRMLAQDPPPGVDDSYWLRPGVWDERDLGTLLDANKRWSQRMVQQTPTFFEEHKRGHAPKILWIGCSDARVPVNEMIGEPPGSVFVHRNIANMVVNTDFNCMSVIQYAVDVLKVKHIVVCGHYDCGGVKAALTNTDHRSPLENWLRNIRDSYRLHKAELDEIPDLRERQRKLVELNVIEQCLNVFKTAVVQRRRVETYEAAKVPGSLYTFSEPVVHAFVYEPTTGQAKKLEVDFRKYLKELADVYDLYNHEQQTLSPGSRPASTASASASSSSPSSATAPATASVAASTAASAAASTAGASGVEDKGWYVPGQGRMRGFLKRTLFGDIAPSVSQEEAECVTQGGDVDTCAVK